MNALPSVLILCSLVFASCQYEYPITRRAKKQLQVSLPIELDEYSRGSNDWSIKELKTVYENDSISILQFTAQFADGNGRMRLRDYRYTYLIDIRDSYVMRQAIFLEKFQNILCMPDKLIKECREEVKRTGESVYESSIGSCETIWRNFDDETDCK